MKSFIFSISFFFSLTAFCQFKEILVDSIYKYQSRKLLFLEDSVIKEYNAPLIEVFDFSIKISKAAVNSLTGEFRLAGRICFSDASNCGGLPGVAIEKGIRDERDILTNVEFIAYTRDNSNIKNAGIFDVVFKLSEQESLLFYMPHFYLEEFKLGKLIFRKPI